MRIRRQPIVFTLVICFLLYVVHRIGQYREWRLLHPESQSKRPFFHFGDLSPLSPPESAWHGIRTKEQQIVKAAMQRSVLSNFTLECRNTVQGPDHITDDKGFLCPIDVLLASGCCDPTQSEQYTCQRCDSKTGCCPTYEECVSCCLRPSMRSLVLQLLTRAHRRVFRTVSDSFGFCRIECRTSSRSVVHQNAFRNPSARFCYM